MYEKPNLNTPLAQIRENIAKWNASLQIFNTYAEGDSGYRRRAWDRERCAEGSPLGPLTLEQVMDLAHNTWPKRWVKWKAEHPDPFTDFAAALTQTAPAGGGENP